MYYKKFVLITFLNLIFLSSIYAIDFTTLKEYTLKNSKLLEIIRFNIDISKSELDYINSDKYPSIAIGISSERSKGLNDNFYIGDNNVSSSSFMK